MAEQPWTIGRLLDWTTQFFAAKGVEFPRLDAEVLLAHALGSSRIKLYTSFDEVASEQVRQQFRSMVQQRVEGCPVAYLVGFKEFFSIPLQVNRSVLIPRPDTEILVMEALRLLKPMHQATLLDVGTGSGAIAIALAKNHPTVQITAIDCSADALSVARQNAKQHGVEHKVTFHISQLFNQLPKDVVYDIIVSNPPYIPTDAIAHLPAGVRDFEPHMALDGGKDGFQVITQLISDARPFLKKGGYLLIEIGVAQEQRVREIMSQYSELSPPSTIQDYSGHPRVLKTQKVM